MKRFIPAVLLATIVALVLSACSPQEKNCLVESEFKWSDFLWVQDKAAIYIPVRLQGNPYTWFMQHDTGAPQVHFYGLQYNDLTFDHQVEKKSNGKPLLVSFDGQIGEFDTTNNYFAIRQGYGTPIKGKPGQANIGTIGLDFFQGKVLLMDFVNARFSMTDSLEKVPIGILDQVAWFPAKGLEDNRFIITVKINGQDYDLMYDTGASSLDVTAWDKTLWSELTGKQENDAGVIRSSGPSWGQIIEILTASAKEDLQLGDLSFPQPDVCYSPAHTNMDAGVGSLGNSLFYDKYTVIFDLINSRFGLVESEPTYQTLPAARGPKSLESSNYSAFLTGRAEPWGEITLSAKPTRSEGVDALEFATSTNIQGMPSSTLLTRPDLQPLLLEIAWGADASVQAKFDSAGIRETALTPQGSQTLDLDCVQPVYDAYHLRQLVRFLPLTEGYGERVQAFDSVNATVYPVTLEVTAVTETIDSSGTSYDCYLVEFSSPMGRERGWYTTDALHTLIRYESEAIRLELKPGR